MDLKLGPDRLLVLLHFLEPVLADVFLVCVHSLLVLHQSLALQILLPQLGLFNLHLPLDGQDLFSELVRGLVEQDGLLEQLLCVIIVCRIEDATCSGRLFL
jgi:hypothetical protein